MALTPETIITQVVSSPAAAGAGLAAGFILAKALDWRKNRNQFGGI
jgi:hypothetical protein